MTKRTAIYCEVCKKPLSRCSDSYRIVNVIAGTDGWPRNVYVHRSECEVEWRESQKETNDETAD